MCLCFSDRVPAVEPPRSASRPLTITWSPRSAAHLVKAITNENRPLIPKWTEKSSRRRPDREKTGWRRPGGTRLSAGQRSASLPPPGYGKQGDERSGCGRGTPTVAGRCFRTGALRELRPRLVDWCEELAGAGVADSLDPRAVRARGAAPVAGRLPGSVERRRPYDGGTATRGGSGLEARSDRPGLLLGAALPRGIRRRGRRGRRGERPVAAGTLHRATALEGNAGTRLDGPSYDAWVRRRPTWVWPRRGREWWRSLVCPDAWWGKQR